MTALSPASSAYYHPRRPRPIRVGDRVRIVAEGWSASPADDRPNNYPGAHRYGTVLRIHNPTSDGVTVGYGVCIDSASRPLFFYDSELELI